MKKASSSAPEPAAAPAPSAAAGSAAAGIPRARVSEAVEALGVRAAAAPAGPERRLLVALRAALLVRLGRSARRRKPRRAPPKPEVETAPAPEPEPPAAPKPEKKKKPSRKPSLTVMDPSDAAALLAGGFSALEDEGEPGAAAPALQMEAKAEQLPGSEMGEAGGGAGRSTLEP